MKRLRSHTTGVDSGDVTLFSDYEDGGAMWTGRGQRERRRHIRFSEPYLEPPTVQLSPSLWDLDAATIMRADITAESVTKSGFDMVFRTWGDTRVARMRISWIAIGQLSDESDWDIA
ncbi:H-type lectin domain protein [Sulfitobacter sp. THAF37]|uniref:H-type lectin domain-containing protein n=1 Tax=Sulfitobacter sp. THAF37 TaxID=2587855 RepID=UPI0012A8419B|nr:H-type lectin domain-containing protein [Sulfitobacter sp. THAF37]QFT57484.1 H-type lectin domain protein [Sulfitobacter sp. THAF37]